MTRVDYHRARSCPSLRLLTRGCRSGSCLRQDRSRFAHWRRPEERQGSHLDNCFLSVADLFSEYRVRFRSWTIWSNGLARSSLSLLANLAGPRLVTLQPCQCSLRFSRWSSRVALLTFV